jgi:hypothetical protein
MNRRDGKIGFVDRQKLEASGVVENRGRHWVDHDSTLYASLQTIRDKIAEIEARYDAEPDIQALKQAMADAHPDRGGSSAAFIRARQEYVEARRRVRSA